MIYDEVKKKFIDNINKLSYASSPFNVFDDLMELYAIEYTNPFIVFPDDAWKKREERYAEILQKYQKNKELLLENFTLITEAHEAKQCDFLGDVFMVMALNDKKSKAQVFTPYSVGQMMAESCFTKESVQKCLEDKNYINILDPAVGGGCLMIAAFHRIRELGLNPQQMAFFMGADLDKRCCRMAFIQLSVLGAKARIDNMDSLTLEHFETFYTPAFRMGGIFNINVDNCDKEVAEAFEPMKKDAEQHLKKKYKDDPEEMEKAKQNQLFHYSEQLTLF